jgi:pimeloyl-ACP methyl ester carboxylesterase
LILSGCSTLAEEFAKHAAELKLKREIFKGVLFQHVIYSRLNRAAKTLHVYLDGDGTPWIAGRPSDDPTPRNPVVLNLMSLDKAPSAYVGRPCYHGFMSNDACSSRYWLNDRYSEAVVTSLSSVIKQLLRRGGFEKVAWFGHSGGGTLAMLLASRFSQTRSVVTVAANLDLDAWAVYTGHNDLSGSLNPVSLPPLPQQVLQRHYAGAKDRVVPPDFMAQAARILGSELIVISNYDHVCCWEQIWPNILNELEDSTTADKITTLPAGP